MVNAMTIFDFLDKHDIKYKDKKLIENAFMHSSYVNENKSAKSDNERLEFMGDAVLQIWSADKLFHITPAMPEGKMTTRRANLVCEKALAFYVREYHLNDFLLLGQGEEKTGGRDRDSVISDMFEAFIGAVYLDTDYYNAAKLLDILVGPHVNTEFEAEVDYKTKLQEYVQSDTRKAITYVTESMTGPSNNPVFVVSVMVDGLKFGEGAGHSKKAAQKEAAKNALEKMVKK